MEVAPQETGRGDPDWGSPAGSEPGGGQGSRYMAPVMTTLNLRCL